MTTIFAHRGLHQCVPENSMRAFRAAVLHEVEGIETDVHLTKDQIPVLIHSEFLKKITDSPLKVSDLTLNQLKQLNLKNTEDTIPTLEELLCYLKIVDYKGTLNLEIKTGRFHYRFIENITVEMVNHYRGNYRVIFSSFYAPSVIKIHQLTDLEVAYLYRWSNKIAYELYQQGIVQSFHPLYLFVGFKEKNVPIRPWTVNNSYQIKECFKHNNAGIFTNEYDLAVKIRDEYKLK